MGLLLAKFETMDLRKYQLEMNYNTFDLKKQRVYEYIVMLRQTKLKNHHKTNNKCEGGKRRHLVTEGCNQFWQKLCWGQS